MLSPFLFNLYAKYIMQNAGLDEAQAGIKIARNKELIIWTTVSSQSCFFWLYRASPSLAAKNIISLISVLTIWWCPCVELCLVLLDEGVHYDQCVLLVNSVSLCPASFCTPTPNVPVTPRFSWLTTFVFQSPMMKRTSFFGVSSRRPCRSS